MLIAVSPDFQGKGYGSKLMRPLFARMDRERMPCYLETHTEKNVSLYQHYGFKLVEERVIPGSQVKQRAMLREPR
jgi:ribosomal protein S18 acetylase RimI-like enzyme